MAIIKEWKQSLEQQYPNIRFDILLSIDFGDEDIQPSVTLRFWTIRDGYHFIIPSVAELEKFAQPILMEQVNYQ
jgi:hypothetical protein